MLLLLSLLPLLSSLLLRFAPFLPEALLLHSSPHFSTWLWQEDKIEAAIAELITVGIVNAEMNKNQGKQRTGQSKACRGVDFSVETSVHMLNPSIADRYAAALEAYYVATDTAFSSLRDWLG